MPIFPPPPGVHASNQGASLANNPHKTINFKGDVIATDAGGGVVDVQVGGLSNGMAFSYTVIGTEPDLENLTIALPVARGSAAYLVFTEQLTAAAQLARNVPAAGRTINDFVLALSAPASAGDVFAFFVLG